MKTEEFAVFYRNVELGCFPQLVGIGLTDSQIVAIDVLIVKRMKLLVEYQQNIIHTRRIEKNVVELKQKQKV